MKTHKTLLFILAAVLAGAAPANCFEFIRAKEFTLAEGETLETDTWILAGNIAIAGEAMDDLFLCATPGLFEGDEHAEDVILTGVFRSDVWALGNTIKLSGPVAGHARLAGKRITVADSVGRSVILLGNTVDLSETSELESGGILVGENLMARGLVHGDLTLKGRKVTISGRFFDNVRIVSPDIAILPKTEILGNLSYQSGEELILDKNVAVSGEVVRELPPERTAQKRALFSRTSILVQGWLLCGALLAGLVFASLFPAFTARSVAKTLDSFWLCALVGMAAFAVFPIVIFFAAMSIVGIPLSFLLTLVFFLLIYLSKIVVAVAIGALLLGREWRTSFAKLFFSLLTGLLLLYAGANAGLAGLAVWCIATFTGMGAMLIVLFTPAIPAAMPAASQHYIRDKRPDESPAGNEQP